MKCMLDEESKTEENITDQKELTTSYLKHLHKETETQKRFEISGIRESFKYHTTVFTFIFSATIAGVYFSINLTNTVESLLFLISLFFLPLMGFYLIHNDIKGMRIAYSRFLKRTFLLMEINKKIECSFKGDVSFTSEEFNNWLITDLEDDKDYDTYEEDELDREDNYLSHIILHYRIFKYLLLVILIIIITKIIFVINNLN